MSNRKSLTWAIVAVFILVSTVSAQMSAVDVNSPPDCGPKGDSSRLSSQSPDLSAKSSNDVDYTINRPDAGGNSDGDNSTSVIPEPGTLILVGLGFAAIGLHRKFKK